MKFFTVCKKCKRRTYLVGMVAESRITFAQQIQKKKVGVPCGGCNTHGVHSVNDVYAEGSGSVIGVFLLGFGICASLFVGPVGIILGGAIGAVVGAGWDSAEAEQVRIFNVSVVM